MLGDAVSRKFGKPYRVDLHHPNIDRPVFVAVDGRRVHSTFNPRDGVEKPHVDLMVACGPAPAGGMIVGVKQWGNCGFLLREGGG